MATKKKEPAKEGPRILEAASRVKLKVPFFASDGVLHPASRFGCILPEGTVLPESAEIKEEVDFAEAAPSRRGSDPEYAELQKRYEALAAKIEALEKGSEGKKEPEGGDGEGDNSDEEDEKTTSSSGTTFKL